MSYRIQYSSGNKKKYPVKTPLSKKAKGLIAAGAAAVLLMLCSMNYGQVIKSLLLPGDPDVTAAALSAMIADIQAGGKLADAVSAFCLEIIENAKK